MSCAALGANAALVRVERAQPLARASEASLVGGAAQVHAGVLNLHAGSERIVTLLLVAGDGVVAALPATLRVGEASIEVAAPDLEAQALLDTLPGAPKAAQRIVDFLLEHGWSKRSDLRSGSPLAPLVGALLAACAQPDGFVEQFVQFSGSGGARTLVTGWSAALAHGTHRLLVDAGGGDLASTACEVATYPRDDLEEGRRGCVLVLDRGLSPRSIYHRDAGTWRCLSRHAQARRLDAVSASDTLRALLPRLRAEPHLVDGLRAMSRGAFDGRETLSRCGLPVRIGLDSCLRTDDAVLLNGWLADPRGHVRAVRLRNTLGAAARIDTRWVRSARADVASALEGEAGFHAIAEDAATLGFMAYAGALGTQDGGAWFVELDLDDEQVAFVPISMRVCGDPIDLRALLGQFDYRGAGAGTALEHHLAPFVRAAARAGDTAFDCTDFGPAPRRDDLEVIISAHGPLGPMLAQLGVHGDAAGLRLAIVTTGLPPADDIDTLAGLAEFYGHSLRVLRTGASDRVSALATAARRAHAPQVLVLSSDVYAGAPGWVELLRAGAGDAAFASPALVHEDGSIRHAGRAAPRVLPRHAVLGDTPPSPLRSRFDGYPQAWCERAGADAEFGVTLECCLASRTALLDVADAHGGGFVGGDAAEAAFWRHAAARGQRSRYVANVQLVALDPQAGSDREHWQRCAAIVDGFNLQRADTGYAA